MFPPPNYYGEFDDGKRLVGIARFCHYCDCPLRRGITFEIHVMNHTVETSPGKWAGVCVGRFCFN
jgi:hypothetical protein